jgi:thiamine-monophosphate kinase
MSGEFDRIRSIIRRLGPVAAADIGDDCALVPEGPGQLVISTDLSVEGVHFRTDWLSFEEIGWRAASGALSDLAAQGAHAVGLTASVGMPATAPESDLLELMRGVGLAVYQVGGVVLGGDLSRAPNWMVDITVLGRAARPVTRRGARAGDGVWVSGELGGARAALTDLLAGQRPGVNARLSFAHPMPLIALGARLGAAGVGAMMDLSDGLAGDAPQLARASGVQLEIDLTAIPVHPDVARAAVAVGEGIEEFAARGGEDYELLFTTALSDTIMKGIAAASGSALTRIGSVVDGEGVRFLRDGQPQRLEGYDHFA